MRLQSIELSGFKSCAKKTRLEFSSAITSIVGPNGSGKSNLAESFRFVLGEQSMKSMRGKRGEDMIWNGSPAVPRAGRASVKLVFDNRDRALNLDFDEVSLERVVNRDGNNEYVLNGSPVRLRDITEVLAHANIGASGHHIISQGEADRILSASPRERREMLEDALGLTAYLYKKVDAEKKLEKTAENVREVESLRRELAPHLKFLRAQVKKFEESQKLRDVLAENYLEYLKRESVYLRVSKELLAEESDEPKQEHSAFAGRIAQLRAELAVQQNNITDGELARLEDESRAVALHRSTAVRDLGRIEGELAAAERMHLSVRESIPADEAREFAERVEKESEDIVLLDSEQMKHRVIALTILAKEFLRRIVHPMHEVGTYDTHELLEKKLALEREAEDSQSEESRIADEIAALRADADGEKDASREAERELYMAMSRRSELETAMARLHAREEMLAREESQLKSEIGDAAFLIGREVAGYAEFDVCDEGGSALSDADIADEPRVRQEDRLKKIERMKIRLEESGAGNQSEVLKEHAETSERDEFLAHELADLAASEASLRMLIAELTKTLETRFADGIKKINVEFDSFFKLMFGGGSAGLSIVRELPFRKRTDVDEAVEEGVDVSISIPHKQLKGMHMLSGGERALTSIALIFAMSQVNPPPFLILDETDAALDEANSRRYGDMIGNLARSSQLIVITHNRETMSRAGILYGVTMGRDGVSKLLSVRFEDAVAVAK